jgi:hypothetical protein
MEQTISSKTNVCNFKEVVLMTKNGPIQAYFSKIKIVVKLHFRDFYNLHNQLDFENHFDVW